ncbi:30S ribosomal protein S9 [candidate division WWE3 bacterium RIFOXYB1_FULL_43_24]|uniref:Small ribosomal subunit protein uS9 n=2 Tax=Katanobacteria TaxID=422282 RepID=A0A0G0YKH0_UNCKA|nr:MAG: 30S ribosomal protein S9 [candidate division WWE3 bacterium GW2011_GWA1_42_12]KKS34011.1 MAG: 30S ribosomal protein S9 [candidate division WWE3 bacterium GW2011_GWD1_42_14]KKS37200.1 MAG: 30S ribosomal protein S9 [candidate division WWE3 bacterium GW2011_GWF1_42_14]KKS40061.1 MAG: 30S ribosomal protein S9 [candidate division WWE3 bacterium GW2011_GWE1_42_16]KKS66745.1 MAG: 30S ribosomal protein S9 [candidate division WWE3 bacterium GW2011_GWB1_42_6]OGC61203.1 MAG: 30S ribosomal protein
MVKEKIQERAKIEPKFFSGTGRRKTAVARVFMWDDKGDITVNGMDINEYFPSEKEQIAWTRPFHILGISHPKAKFKASIKVAGSGKSAQLGAVAHGISVALSRMNEEYSVMLHKQGLMTRDSRMVERKKPNLHKARKASQYSKR